MMNLPETASTRHVLERVRHETRRRALTVTRVEDLNAVMRRIHLHSPELADFVSASPDDHLKLIVKQPDGSEIRRDYTPRLFDRAACTLVIDFAMHEGGPATDWARGAIAGSSVEIGGPRGSVIVPDDFDWYLLIGDATALPAISRRIEEMGRDVAVVSIALVDSLDERQHFETQARWSGEWVVKDGANDVANLCACIDRVFPKAGEGFVWIAAEAGLMAALRDHVSATYDHPKQWMKAAGYWVRGAAQE